MPPIPIMSTEILVSCAKTKQAEAAKTSAVNIVRFSMRQNPRNLPRHFDVNPQKRRPRHINRKQDHAEKAATGRRRSRRTVLRWNPTLRAQEIERRIATATPPNRLTTQRRLLQRAGGDAHGCNNDARWVQSISNSGPDGADCGRAAFAWRNRRPRDHHVRTR